MHPNKKRLRRSMMFLNCQKPGLIKDPYIYKPDSIMLDLEDAVAENQKGIHITQSSIIAVFTDNSFLPLFHMSSSSIVS